MRHIRNFLLLQASLLLGVANTPAAAIQFFRSDQGIAKQAGALPDNFDKAPHWRAPLDSGHSTPVVVGDRVFLTTYNAAAQELATVALNMKDGSVAWKRAAPAPKIEEYHRQTGNAAPCTPATDGERLYVFFGSYGLICYDLNGKQLWERRMGPFRDEYGAGSSPVLVDDKIVLNEDHDIDSFLIALNRFNGKPVWKTARPEAVRSYSTPAVWTHEGRKQLIVAGALELAGYDASKGEKLWSKHGLARIVIPVPVPMGETIYMAAWAPGGDTGAGRISFLPWPAALEKWDKNKDGKLARAEIDDANVLDRFFRMDLDQSGTLDQKEWERHAEVFRRAENCVIALKPSSARGELSEGDVLWKYRRGVPYVATPLVDQGILWMVKDGGIVTKLDTATGNVIQEERLPAVGNYYASPVTGDGKVYFSSEQGVVSVVANQRDWKVISSHKFGEKMYASPVIDRDHVLIRTEKALYCF